MGMRNEYIMVRLTETEKQMLVVLAEGEGRSLSGLLRWLAMEKAREMVAA